MKNINRLLLLAGFTFVNVANDLMAMASKPNPDPNAPPPPAWVSFVPMLAMVAVFYFLLIRPQSKQRQEKQRLVENLKKGDKVLTQRCV